MVDLQKLLEDLQQCFFERLEGKTAWGREQIKLQFKYAVRDTLSNRIHEEVRTCQRS